MLNNAKQNNHNRTVQYTLSSDYGVQAVSVRLNHITITFKTGKVAIGSLEDRIIESSTIYFSERAASRFPDSSFKMMVWMLMEKRVEKIPKKLMDKKFWKNSVFFIL